MIALLRGRIVRLGDDNVVIDTGGVGYLVHCDGRNLAAISIGDSVELTIETQVREDAITLFGFREDADRLWFKRLQSIPGVGARSALALLSVLDAEALSQAVLAQDRAALTRANGVGPKLAARILSELKDRLPAIASSSRPVAVKVASTSASATDDAVTALVQLGFGRSEAFAAVQRLAAGSSDPPATEQLIRDGLRELAQ